MAQFKAVTGNTLIYNNGGCLKGLSLRATGATVVNVRNGTTASGTIVVVLNLATATSQTLENMNIEFPNGIYLEVASGAVVGSVWFE